MFFKLALIPERFAPLPRNRDLPLSCPHPVRRQSFYLIVPKLLCTGFVHLFLFPQTMFIYTFPTYILSDVGSKAFRRISLNRPLEVARVGELPSRRDLSPAFRPYPASFRLISSAKPSGDFRLVVLRSQSSRSYPMFLPIVRLLILVSHSLESVVIFHKTGFLIYSFRSNFFQRDQQPFLWDSLTPTVKIGTSSS